MIDTLLSSELLAQAKRLELRAKRALSLDLVGNYRSAFRGSGLLYSDLREYQTGDDPKHIHWAATARSSGKAYVKSYQEERSVSVVLLLDASPSMKTTLVGVKSKWDTALQFSALISLLAAQQGDGLGFCIFAEQVAEFTPVRRSRYQVERLVQSLSSATMTSLDTSKNTNLNIAITKLLSMQRRRCIVFLVSDFLFSLTEEDLRLLGLRHDVILVHSIEPFFQHPPSVGIVECKDAETGAVCEIDLSSTKVRKELSLWYQKEEQRIRDIAQRCDIDKMALVDNVFLPLNALMQRRSAKRTSSRSITSSRRYS